MEAEKQCVGVKYICKKVQHKCAFETAKHFLYVYQISSESTCKMAAILSAKYIRKQKQLWVL